ncbi:hypothetical protein DB30_03071 [Enhygromyxa salina]|uniref:Uncharacterized protein n=1 Tax=Enhygromyxa salina TaxID=215803 RepID=A0A0C2D7J2_9BACT|nr:hypothetical protein DB30_03071 [Enhygromyxa salina]
MHGQDLRALTSPWRRRKRDCSQAWPWARQVRSRLVQPARGFSSSALAMNAETSSSSWRSRSNASGGATPATRRSYASLSTAAVGGQVLVWHNNSFAVRAARPCLVPRRRSAPTSLRATWTRASTRMSDFSSSSTLDPAKTTRLPGSGSVARASRRSGSMARRYLADAITTRPSAPLIRVCREFGDSPPAQSPSHHVEDRSSWF